MSLSRYKFIINGLIVCVLGIIFYSCSEVIHYPVPVDSMKRMYTGWYDHFDSGKNLYYIPAMPDATEYTIASIDASGGKDGFEDGEAFRPTINKSYCCD